MFRIRVNEMVLPDPHGIYVNVSPTPLVHICTVLLPPPPPLVLYCNVPSWSHWFSRKPQKPNPTRKRSACAVDRQIDIDSIQIDSTPAIDHARHATFYQPEPSHTVQYSIHTHYKLYSTPQKKDKDRRQGFCWGEEFIQFLAAL